MRHALPLLCLFPLLTAGVRLQSGADAIPLAPLEKPSPLATRLPAAMPLAAPTQPEGPLLPAPAQTTLLWSASPTAPLSPTIVSASTVSATAVASATAPQPDLTLIPPLSATLCDKALATTSELALLSYQEESTRPILKLAIAATIALAEVQGGHWPTLKAFHTTRQAFPFTAPHRAEVLSTADAAIKLCTNPTPPPSKGPTAGSSLFIPRPE